MKSIILFSALLLGLFSASTAQDMTTDKTIYQFEMNSLQGEPISLDSYKDKVILVVNVASKCGLTPQYADLQEMHDRYQDQGLVILGFPANNFAGQEPGSDSEIQDFCQVNYGVTFQMFSKISVKGDDQHPLYQFLTQKEKNGVADSEMQWNFQKFLIGKDGHLIETISPTTKVTEEAIVQKIEGLLD